MLPNTGYITLKELKRREGPALCILHKGVDTLELNSRIQGQKETPNSTTWAEVTSLPFWTQNFFFFSFTELHTSIVMP